jgi:hypothetical protein
LRRGSGSPTASSSTSTSGSATGSGRLLTALAYNPFAAGIGLDEDTAAFISPYNVIEVEGSGGITLVDASGIEFSSMDKVAEGEPVCMLGVRLHLLVAGARFDLATRQATGTAAGNARTRAAAQRYAHHRDEEFAMRILDRSVYVGPSLYAHFPVIRLELDLGRSRTGRRRGWASPSWTACCRRLPGLAEHGCSYREPGGFLRRLREGEGTWLGHVLEHVAIELQNVAGEDVTFGKTRSTDKPGVYSVVYEYAQREEGIEAGELAMRLLDSLLPAELRTPGLLPGDWDWPEARDAFIPLCPAPRARARPPPRSCMRPRRATSPGCG